MGACGGDAGAAGTAAGGTGGGGTEGDRGVKAERAERWKVLLRGRRPCRWCSKLCGGGLGLLPARCPLPPTVPLRPLLRPVMPLPDPRSLQPLPPSPLSSLLVLPPPPPAVAAASSAAATAAAAAESLRPSRSCCWLLDHGLRCNKGRTPCEDERLGTGQMGCLRWLLRCRAPSLWKRL